jgi:hypothetical protein
LVSPTATTNTSQRGKADGEGGGTAAKPAIKVHIIGDAPAETPCLHCHQTGNVKRITNASVVGGKSETLHQGCAQAWFAKL